MTRQAIIVFAVLLGAGLAGLLWYQLTRTPEDEIALLSPTPIISESPVATATPVPTSEQMAEITPEPSSAPVAVGNTAPTGMGEVTLAVTVAATLVGGYGLRRSF